MFTDKRSNVRYTKTKKNSILIYDVFAVLTDSTASARRNSTSGRRSEQRPRPILAVLALLLVACWPLTVGAELVMPAIFSDNMVIQRDMPTPVWGTALPGAKVSIRLLTEDGRRLQMVQTPVGADGKWLVRLAPVKSGPAYRLEVEVREKPGDGNIQRRVIGNVQAGEVWLCAGQSNMQMSLSGVVNKTAELAAANYPLIRQFTAERVFAARPAADVKGVWRLTTPQIMSMNDEIVGSGVAYLFGRELHRRLGVPVGLINVSWNGSRIEPWTTLAGFEMVPKLRDLAAQLRQQILDQAAAQWGASMALYNGMVHPLVPYAVRGAIWYQGESNCQTSDGMLYYEKMKALVGGWRKAWSEEDFPFFYVQLTPFTYKASNGATYKLITPESLPEIWEAQTAALSIPNTGMAVTTDIVKDLGNIHPPDKQTIARRLGQLAMAKVYGQKSIVYSGPIYKSMDIEGNAIRIRFDYVAGGLRSRDGKPLNWFSIAGADKRFVEAETKIDRDTVIVSSTKASKPVAVRFGWNEIAQPNLMNAEGLPATPFRTDGPQSKITR